MDNHEFDYIRLHFIVLLGGLTPSVVKLISLPSLELVFFRTLITVVILSAYILYRRYRFQYTFAQILRMTSSGILLSLYWVFFILAAKIATASVAAVGVATTTLWITLLEPLLFKRRTEPFQGLMALNAIFGIYIIYNSDFQYDKGFAFGIAAGFFAALLTIQSSRFSRKNYNPFSVTLYQMLGAFIGTSLFIPIYITYLPSLSQGSFIYDVNITDLLLIIFLVLTFSIYAWSTFIRVMQTLPPFTVALVNNLTPIYAIIVAIFFFGKAELMNIGFYIGTLLLLVSVFAYPLLRRYNDYMTRKKGDKKPGN